MADRRHYEVLCIPQFSSAEEVRVAYKALALKYHPDKNLGDPTAADRFRAVSRAYEVLSNEETKRKYDLALRSALGRYVIQTNGTSGGQEGSTWYSMSSSMSDVYRELYQRQAARANTRNRTASAPPQNGKTTASQYTKEQQEHFRKRERERQQELRRQREKERKEQRDREREALRKEQERQEELLQQRWRQQQQQHRQMVQLMRASPTATASAAAPASTTVASDSAACAEGSSGASSRVRRGLPRVSVTEGLRSARESCAPSTVLLGTSVRSTASLRNSTAATPRTCRAGSSLSSSRRLAAKLASPEAGPSGVPSPSSALREETTDTEAMEGGSSVGWYTPFSASVNDGGAEEGLARVNSLSSYAGSAVGAQEKRMTQSKGICRAPQESRASFLRPASAADGASSVDAPPTVAVPEGTTTKHTTPEDYSDDGAAASCGDNRHHPSSSYRSATHIRTVNGAAVPSTSSESPTPRNWGTPRGFTRFHASPAVSSSLPGPLRGQRGTPRGGSSTHATANGRNHCSSARVPVTGAGLMYTLQRNSGGINGATSGSSPAHSTFPYRARPMASLPNEDKEVLDKNRRERLAKEQERQRAARLAEEDRQQRRLACAAKQQRSRAAAAAAESETEEPDSFERQLGYLLQDEASERDQLIEREEQLARRRLHRQHTATVEAVVLRPCLGELTREERAVRSGLLQVFRAERDCHFFHYYERLGRLYVECREGRYRRQLVGRGAADRYHLQRLSQRRDSKAAEEALQRRRLSGSVTHLLLGQGSPVEEAEGRASLSAVESKARHRTVSNLHEAAPPYHSPDGDARLAGSHPWQQQQSRCHQEHLDEGLSPASYPLPATGTFSAVGPTGDGSRTATSSTATAEVSTTGYSASFLLATGASEAAAAMVDQLPGDSDSTRASAQASRYLSPKQCSLPASLTKTDRASLTVNGSTNGEPKMLPTGAERRLLTLLSDEAHQRGLLARQQQQEEIALRCRRATAMHRVFAKDRENAIKHAQRCALMEVAALKAQVRMLQRQMGCSSSLRSLEGGSLAVPTSTASGSPSNSASWQAESTMASRRGSPPPMPSRPTSEATAAARAPSSNTARALSVANTFTALAALGGWTALPDSDAEDE